MSDECWPQSRTPLDAAMGDPLAAGLYGDPVRDNFGNVPAPVRRRELLNFDFRHISPKRRLVIAALCIAVFVISTVVSPYILN